MSSIILEAKSLTKEYKQTLALDHINLQIKKGKIYGFIGQNGAGKTTFLRLVTGLAFPTSGTLSLWGNSGTEELQKQRKRIGSMIETPALFPSMTAYQNMEVQRIQRGIPDKSVIKRTLDMVGLQDTGKKSVRNFSLGMRQRLGIAIALLNTPDLILSMKVLTFPCKDSLIGFEYLSTALTYPVMTTESSLISMCIYITSFTIYI